MQRDLQFTLDYNLFFYSWKLQSRVFLDSNNTQLEDQDA